MKLIRKTVLWIVLLLLLMLTVGCEDKSAASTPTTPAVTTPSDPPEPTEDLLQKELTEKYIAAVEASYGDSFALRVQSESSVTVAGITYRESHDVIQDYRDMGADSFIAKVNDTVTYGDNKHTVEYQEIFSGGTVYQKIDEARFYSEQTASDFLDRYTPAQMLTPELYTLSANEGDTLISFESATAGESWVLPEEDAELISASGTVQLDDDGKILKTTYTVTFRYGAAEHTVHYEASAEELGREPAAPKDTEDYVLLDEIEGTLVLEHFYGYLSQLHHGSVNTYELMMSEAAGVYTSVNTSFDAYAQGTEYAAQTTSNAMAYTADGTSEKAEVQEKMVDGKYTYTLDGKKETASSQMTQEIFEGEATNQLLALTYGSAYVQSLDVSVVGDSLLVEVKGNEIMGEELCYDTGVRLFQDGALLDSYATDYRTEKTDYYIALDRYSLLPTAMGIDFEGIHTIDGYELAITHQLDRSIDMASMSAYTNIFEETEPETAPEDTATPLFYHVTGADGQEMWLLGTIHLGDVRTGFLPEEIYDAFYDSDAFAVECDTDEFSGQAEEDEELQEQISELYFYSDDTTIADHIDTPKLYDAAKQLMKATGNYYYNAEYMKPYLWSSSIENYYLRGSYSLSSEKGVEQRLLKLADEADIPVREVESTLFQMEMLTTYSDEMQELMLYGTVCSGIWDYCESVQEIYELWCAGDEKALTEKINNDEDESWQISEEDIDLTELEGEDLERAQAVLENLDAINAQLAQLQEEYSSSMYMERNAGMLEIAVEYLESGDVVFYAVGLAHLLAEDGLVNTLRDAGYTVELVAYQ